MNNLYKLQQKIMTTPWFYWLVMGISLIGSIYGFYWYKYQLAVTPFKFWFFTPDCPRAVFFFLIWVFLVAKNLPSNTFRVIVVADLIKYGIWTTSVIGLFWFDRELYYFQHIMLFTSHFGMLVLGVVFATRMKISRRGFWIASIWLFVNDFVDYYFGVFPWLPDGRRLPEVRFGTFLLTGFIIIWMFVVYYRSHHRLGHQSEVECLDK
ncbi:MAG: DUF1405 domain-containing protein [Halanaerobiales bacterium]|nr:DUF1405 domain-containing protein [Halanaerobiales bacterium]